MTDVLATYVLQIRGDRRGTILRLTNAYLRELEENIESTINVGLVGKPLGLEVKILEWDSEELVQDG